MKSSLFSAKWAPQHKPFVDIVGLEVGVALDDGVPAVRIRKRENKIELMASGFLKLAGQLPEIEEAPSSSTPVMWTLPHAFQAPHAALAVSSKQGFFRHLSDSSDPAPDKSSTVFRKISRYASSDLPALEAGLPEVQAAWAAKLFPEGRRPTTCSLQVSSAAALNAITYSPAFLAAEGTVSILLVFAQYTALAAFQSARLVLYREHPIGYAQLRSAVSTQMGLDIALADSVLDDTLIDPTPIIEPVLRPLFRQVEISADFLARRRNCKVDRFFICGLPSGTRYWSSVFTQMMNLPLSVWPLFEGVEQSAKQHPHVIPESDTRKQLLAAAYGAARAVLEDL